MTQNKGGAYIVAELDGSVWHEKLGAFRLVPYFARHKIDLPGGIENFVDIATKTLHELKESEEGGNTPSDIWFEKVKHTSLDDSEMHSDENIGLDEDQS